MALLLIGWEGHHSSWLLESLLGCGLRYDLSQVTLGIPRVNPSMANILCKGGSWTSTGEFREARTEKK